MVGDVGELVTVLQRERVECDVRPAYRSHEG